MAAGPDGHAYAVWIDWRGDTPALYWAEQLEESGWSTNLPITDTVGSVGTNDPPSLAVDGQGTLHLLWVDLRRGDGDIYYAARPASGTWSTPERVNDDATSADQRHPSLAVDSAGNAYAVWQDARNGDDDVYFAYRPAGGAWSANSRVNQDATGASQAKPDIAVDGQGNALAAWSRSTAVGRVIEVANRPTAGAWSGAEVVSGVGAGVFYDEPAIATDSAGNAALAWHYRYMDRYTVITVYRRAGGGWSGSYPEPFGFAPDIAMDQAGAAHLVYIGERNPNRIPHIAGAVIPPGGGAWSATQVSDGRVDDALQPPTIAVDDSGRALAVWGGHEEIFSAVRPEGGAWGENEPVADEHCSMPSGRPDLALDAAGSAFPVWAQERSGRSQVSFGHWPAGGDMEPPIQIADASERRDPAVAVDGQGNAVAVWSEWRNRRYEIHARTRRAGSGWGAPLLVATQAGRWLRNPDIAAGASGELVGVWEQVTPDHPEDTVIAFATGQSGGAWSAAAEVPGAAGTSPSVAVDAAGNASLAWKGPAQEIYFSYRPADGAWSNAVAVNTGPAGTAVDHPAIAVDPAGNAVIVWQDARGGSGDWDIYAVRRTASGAWSDNVRIDDSASGNQTIPAAVVDAVGNAYAVWSDARGGDGDVEFAYQPAGGAWARNLRVNDDPPGAEQAQPAIAVDRAGLAIALWLDQRDDAWALFSSRARHADIVAPWRRIFPMILRQ